MKDEDVNTQHEPTVESDQRQSELELPVWAVVGFDRCFASGLKYDDARAELRRLAAEKHMGLCIVTNEAAARIKNDSVL